MEEVNINGETIHLKKSFLGWGVIHPTKVNGKINWKNLIAGGSWFKLIMVVVLVIIILGAINEYTTALRIANECLLTNPQVIVP